MPTDPTRPAAAPPMPWTAVPEITDAMRQQARRQATGKPGLFTVVDPDVRNPDDGVPPWAVRGAFPLSSTGHIDEAAYRANPNYKPGPRAQGLPLPDNRLEYALQLAVTGYAPTTTFLVELRDSPVHVPVAADDPRHVLVGSDDNGNNLFIVYTAPERVPAKQPTTELPFRELAGEISSGATVVINPGSIPEARIAGADIVRLLASNR